MSLRSRVRSPYGTSTFDRHDELRAPPAHRLIDAPLLPRRSERRQTRFCKSPSATPSSTGERNWWCSRSPERREARLASATSCVSRARRSRHAQTSVHRPRLCLAHSAAAGGGAAVRRPRLRLRRCARSVLGRVLDCGVLPGDERAPRVLALSRAPPPPTASTAARGRRHGPAHPAHLLPDARRRAERRRHRDRLVRRRAVQRVDRRPEHRQVHERAAGRVGRGAAQRDGAAPRRGARVDRRAVRRLRRRERSPRASRRRGCGASSTASRSADSSSSIRLLRPACPALRATAST